MNTQLSSKVNSMRFVHHCNLPCNVYCFRAIRKSAERFMIHDWYTSIFNLKNKLQLFQELVIYIAIISLILQNLKVFIASFRISPLCIKIFRWKYSTVVLLKWRKEIFLSRTAFRGCAFRNITWNDRFVFGGFSWKWIQWNYDEWNSI